MPGGDPPRGLPVAGRGVGLVVEEVAGLIVEMPDSPEAVGSDRWAMVLVAGCVVAVWTVREGVVEVSATGGKVALGSGQAGAGAGGGAQELRPPADRWRQGCGGQGERGVSWPWSTMRATASNAARRDRSCSSK